MRAGTVLPARAFQHVRRANVFTTTWCLGMEEDSELLSSCLDSDCIDLRDSFGIDHCTAATLEWIEWEEKVHTRYNLFGDSPTSACCEKSCEMTSMDTYGGSTVHSTPSTVSSTLTTATVNTHPCRSDSIQTNPPSEGERPSEGGGTDGENVESLETMSSKKQRCYFDSDTLALKHNPK